MSMVFVFGSNLAGRHGAGSAAHAWRYYGAVYGKGVGHHGDSYAIPTKDESLNVLPLDVISRYVADFLAYATAHPEYQFHVVSIGCGLAGYTPEQIAPMFKFAPNNVVLSQEFQDVLL